MFKTFAQCSLSDLEYEISAAASASNANILDPSAAQLVLPSLRNAYLTAVVLLQYPLVRSAGALVCTGTSESKHAWCSMLRDLFRASGARVGDAVCQRVYLVCKACAERGYVQQLSCQRALCIPSSKDSNRTLLFRWLVLTPQCSHRKKKLLKISIRCAQPQKGSISRASVVWITVQATRAKCMPVRSCQAIRSLSCWPIPCTAGRREAACSAGRFCSAVAHRRALTRSSGTCTVSTSLRSSAALCSPGPHCASCLCLCLCVFEAYTVSNNRSATPHSFCRSVIFSCRRI